MIDELYIVGDQSRLVVKNIINQLNYCCCDIKVYSPTESQIDNLSNYSIYLLVHLPVIFLTSNNDRQCIINAMEFKPDGYILKSKYPDEIKAAVVDFFKNRIIRM